MFTKSKLNMAVKACAASMVTMGLVACGGADNPTLDTTKPVIEYGEVRFLQASPDAPKVKVAIGENGKEADAFLDNGFGDQKPFFAVPVGEDLSIVVTADIPGHYKIDPTTGNEGKFSKNADGELVVDNENGSFVDETAVLYKGTITVTEGSKQDIVLAGNVDMSGAITDTVAGSDGDFDYDLSTNALTATISDSVAGEITFGHFAITSQATSVDVYAVADCDSIVVGTNRIVSNLAYGSNVTVDAATLPSSYSEVCVTAAGNGTALFDSGSLTLSNGMWINAIDDTSTGTVAAGDIALAIQSGTSYSVAYDDDATSNLRVVHAARNLSSTIDAVIDATNFATNLAFDSASAYTGIAANTGSDDAPYTLDITNNGGATEYDKVTGLVLSPAQSQTVLVVDTKAESSTSAQVDTLLLSDSRRIVATEARLRLIHAAQDIATRTEGQSTLRTVDVFLFKDETAGDDSDDVDITEKKDNGVFKVAPLLKGVDFTNDSGQLSLEAGTYDLSVTTADSTDRATILSAQITVANGEIHTYVVTDTAGSTLSSVALDDATALQ